MSDKSIDFSRLIEKMQQARVADTDRPTILGGQFAADRLEKFLTAWQRPWDQMSFRLWEHISHIEFADAPGEPQFLQRAEVFGEGGHLSLRRDANRWLWHYIGPAGQPPPEGFEKEPECEDFWRTNPATRLRRYNDQAILWGERKTGHNFWWEDRVAAAKLIYPKQGEGRVYLDFWRYTRDGQTVFVWYRNLRTVVSVKGGQ